jgi:hypothetical protein
MSLKIFRKFKPQRVGIDHISCESSSATKIRPFSEKIRGYMQF